MPGGFDGSLGGFAEQGLELGEDLLDGVEIGAVRGAGTGVSRRQRGWLGGQPCPCGYRDCP